MNTHSKINFALNRITCPKPELLDFLQLTKKLGINAIELRNDVAGRELLTGPTPDEIRKMIDTAGLSLITINALQRFNVWNAEREAEAKALCEISARCGAKALVLCPLNSHDDKRSEDQRYQNLLESLTKLAPILSANKLAGLVEPLGFTQSSLRYKKTAVKAIQESKTESVYKLVHDTFHHALAEEKELFPSWTGLIHISGVEDRKLNVNQFLDAHRVLVGPADRLDNIGQIAALLQQGYQGHCSFEAFSAEVQQDPALETSLRNSMQFIVK